MKHRLAIVNLFCLVMLVLQSVVVGKGESRVYLPIVQSFELTCDVPSQSYGTLSIVPPPTDYPAEDHPDINALAVRGYEPTTTFLGLVDYGGGTDPRAPQLAGLFADQRVPTFSSAYRTYRWDWDCWCRDGLNTNWPTTLLGMAVSPGETIHVPDSGYNIGGGNDVLVLYASPNSVTLKYTREDNVVSGYTVHIEGVCVEPRLLGLYESWNGSGREQLPALRGGEAIGRAGGDEIRVAIRDNGSFLDPRSRKDWWQGR